MDQVNVMPYNAATGFAWLLGTDFIIETTVYETPAHTVCVDATSYEELTFRIRQGVPSGAAVVTKTLESGISITGVFNSNPSLNTQVVKVAVAAADTAALNPGPYYWTLERLDSSGLAPLFAGQAVASAAP